MSVIVNNRKMARRPSHPGEILREEFMSDYGLTATRLARDLGVSRQSISELIHEHKALTPEMAVRLSLYFGNSPEQWLGYQRTLDIWNVFNRIKQDEELSSRFCISPNPNVAA
jgi:addiction module HigA family antidote